MPAFADRYLIELFSKITTVRWDIFSKGYRHRHPTTQGHITIGPIADQAFIRSVVGCEGLVTAAGFETPAEALYFGKKLLVIPMKGQYEQQCNAAALEELGMAVLPTLHVGGLRRWIEHVPPIRMAYRHNVPDVVEWLRDYSHSLYWVQVAVGNGARGICDVGSVERSRRDLCSAHFHFGSSSSVHSRDHCYLTDFPWGTRLIRSIQPCMRRLPPRV